jgi:transposase
MEYREAEPAALSYSQFCDLYRCWARKLDLVMRMTHKAGERLFIDYAGL